MDNPELIICRCEEVTQAEILEAIHEGGRSLQDIKRMTRAGMGLCQGRTCQKLVGRLLQRCGRDTRERFFKPPTVRPPVRPLRLGDLAGGRERKA